MRTGPHAHLMAQWTPAQEGSAHPQHDKYSGKHPEAVHVLPNLRNAGSNNHRTSMPLGVHIVKLDSSWP